MAAAASSGLQFAGPKLRDELDAVFREAPLRDRKTLFEEVSGFNLVFIVLKNAGLQALVTLAKPGYIELPEDPVELAKFVLGHIAPPTAKEIAVSLTTRAVENVFISVYPDPLVHGRFVGDRSKVASDVWEARHKLLGDDFTAGEWLKARWDTAWHVGCHVAWQPAIVQSLATLAVGEVSLVAERAWKHVQRSRAEAVIADEKATKAQKRAAQHILEPPEDELPELPLGVAMVDQVVRSAAMVPASILGCVVGTVVYPGLGTMLLEVVASAVVWI